MMLNGIKCLKNVNWFSLCIKDALIFPPCIMVCIIPPYPEVYRYKEIPLIIKNIKAVDVIFLL